MACHSECLLLTGIYLNSETPDDLVWLAFCTGLHPEEYVFTETQLELIHRRTEQLIVRYNEKFTKTRDSLEAGLSEGSVSVEGANAQVSGSSFERRDAEAVPCVHSDSRSDSNCNTVVPSYSPDDDSTISSGLSHNSSPTVEGEMSKLRIMDNIEVAADDSNVFNVTGQHVQCKSSLPVVEVDFRSEHHSSSSNMEPQHVSYKEDVSVMYDTASNSCDDSLNSEEVLGLSMHDKEYFHGVKPTASGCSKFSFHQYVTNEKPFVMMHAVPEVMQSEVFKAVNGPLGVCYDEILEQWAIADQKNDRVLLYPASLALQLKDNMIKPSAVCVLVEGVSLAVLADNCILVYTHAQKNFDIIVGNGRKLQCRGLARTPNMNLLTIRNFGRSPEIVIFSSNACNSELFKMPFPGQSPSFLNICGNRLIVSDLGGNQKVSLWQVDDTHSNNIICKMITEHQGKYDGKGEPNGAFNFVSGVQLDSKGYSLVADAGGHTFQIFDAKLKFLYRVSADFEIPYMSSFAVNSRGQVIICGRLIKRLLFAQLGVTDTILPKLCSPSGDSSFRGGRGNFNNFNRSGGTSGARGGSGFGSRGMGFTKPQNQNSSGFGGDSSFGRDISARVTRGGSTGFNRSAFGNSRGDRAGFGSSSRGFDNSGSFGGFS